MSDKVNLKEELINEFEKAKNEIKKPNIMILGGTGVGKSTLVNLMFGKDVAQTGIGKPLTSSISSFEDPDVPIILYDTMGYEVGTKQQENFYDEVIDYCLRPQTNLNNTIHLCWYCIQASGARFTDVDIKVISKLKKAKIPVAIVITKCDIVSESTLSELLKVIKGEVIDINIFEICYLKDLNYLKLKDLSEWSISSLEKGLKYAFICAQKHSLESKVKEARNIIIQHTSGAAIVGASPIPFSDAPLLITNQAALVVRILNLYNLGTFSGKLISTLSRLGIGTGIASLGIYLAGEIIKFIPWTGTIIGGAINAGVASSITAAIGYSLSEVCYKINKYILEGDIDGADKYIDNLLNTPFLKNLVMSYYKKGKCN